MYQGEPVRSPTREFLFSDKDFSRIREMIYQLAGINLNPSKKDMVYSRLSRRLRILNLSQFKDYLVLVEESLAEREAFINALTTNLTSFFRENHHFLAFAEFLKLHAKDSSIVAWCSASSTGEEPYSILITAIESLGEAAFSKFRLIASDLDTNVLKKAALGVYPLDAVSHLDPERIKRFFLRGRGSQEGMVRIRPEIAQMVQFQQINLLDDHWPVKAPLHVIFCRNVMIYFDKGTQRSILEKFHPLLARDGLLFAGHSENFSNASDIFRLKGKTIYMPLNI